MKKVPDFKVEMWQKDPTEEELREMAGITQSLEKSGVRFDPEAIRRAVVKDDMPKHMTLIAKELLEEQRYERELAYFNLQQRQNPINSDIPGPIPPGSTPTKHVRIVSSSKIMVRQDAFEN